MNSLTEAGSFDRSQNVAGSVTVGSALHAWTKFEVAVLRMVAAWAGVSRPCARRLPCVVDTPVLGCPRSIHRGNSRWSQARLAPTGWRRLVYGGRDGDRQRVAPIRIAASDVVGDEVDVGIGVQNERCRRRRDDADVVPGARVALVVTTASNAPTGADGKGVLSRRKPLAKLMDARASSLCASLLPFDKVSAVVSPRL